MCQEHTRLWRRTMAAGCGCSILPYCHTESLSPRLSNDTWAAVYFCLHLNAEDPTIHIKSSCLQEGNLKKKKRKKNPSLIRCLGESSLWGPRGWHGQNSPFRALRGSVFATDADRSKDSKSSSLKMQTYLIKLNVATARNVSSEPVEQRG